MKYDAAYFIAKFDAIPEKNWCVDSYVVGTSRCAYGHCGEINKSTEESQGLFLLGARSEVCVSYINDGKEQKYPQSTPKQRVLAWLRDAKEAGL